MSKMTFFSRMVRERGDVWKEIWTFEDVGNADIVSFDEKSILGYGDVGWASREFNSEVDINGMINVEDEEQGGVILDAEEV